MSGLVVKLGGHALDTLALDSLELVDLAQDVAHLRAAGTNVAIVHGGGPQIAALLDSLGIASTFHEGLRVTDDATMDGVVMALGRVNLLISTALNQAGLASVGLSGADAALFRASPLGAIWGRASAVPKVCDDIITTLWAAGVTPVVSPIAVDDHGGLLNCNADTAAGALAGALGADELVLLSDVDQLRASFDDAASAMASVLGRAGRRAAVLERRARRHAPQVDGGPRRPRCGRTTRAGGQRHTTTRAARRPLGRHSHDEGAVMTRHFTTIDELGPGDLSTILDRSCSAFDDETLKGQGVALVFERPSLRTRASSSCAVHELGGYATFFGDEEIGLDNRESAEDVGRTLAEMYAIAALRVRDHGVFERMRQATESACRSSIS